MVPFSLRLLAKQIIIKVRCESYLRVLYVRLSFKVVSFVRRNGPDMGHSENVDRTSSPRLSQEQILAKVRERSLFFTSKRENYRGKQNALNHFNLVLSPSK